MRASARGRKDRPNATGILGGMPTKVFAALRVRPEVARSAAGHAAAVMERGTVPQRVKELCALMVSALNGCEY